MRLGSVGVMLVGLMVAVAAEGQQQQQRTLHGAEALPPLRELVRLGRNADGEKMGYVVLWDDIRQPEGLFLEARALEGQNRQQDAAVWYSILLRVLEEPIPGDGDKKSNADAARYRDFARKRLAAIDPLTFQPQATKWLKSAEGKRFPGDPTRVDDLWMTQVKASLTSLHGLYAWKLVGGRKDVKKPWVHNEQGAMHRSGMKYAEVVDGRKGVLFSVPVKVGSERYEREGPAWLTITIAGKCKFLRVGAKAYGFPFVLRARVGEKELFSKPIGKDDWDDLKIDLGEFAGKPETVRLEFEVPKDQKWLEGLWLDYVDFFDD